MRAGPWDIRESSFPRSADLADRARFLLRYALLAPSSHNTQPWRFRIRDDAVELRLDESRRLRIADADGRELRESAGCAIENLVVAADHFGFQADVALFPDPELAARVRLIPGGGHGLDPDLFRAIPHRRTSRAAFNGRAVPAELLEELAGLAGADDVRIDLTADEAVRKRAKRLTARADLRQFADPEWRKELAYWFGQGALGTAWPLSSIGSVVISHFNLSKSMAKGDGRLILSAPVFGMLSARDDAPATQVRVGRAFERLWLKATALGLSLQPVSQMMQIPRLRAVAAGLLGPDRWKPQQPFRLGYADVSPGPTPRRPLEELIDAAPLKAPSARDSA